QSALATRFLAVRGLSGRMPGEDQYPAHAGRPPGAPTSWQNKPLGEPRLSRLEGNAKASLVVPHCLTLCSRRTAAVRQGRLVAGSARSWQRMDSGTRLSRSGTAILSGALEGAVMTRSREAFLERVRRSVEAGNLVGHASALQ